MSPYACPKCQRPMPCQRLALQGKRITQKLSVNGSPDIAFCACYQCQLLYSFANHTLRSLPHLDLLVSGTFSEVSQRFQQLKAFL